jgi:hypothetical protein
MMIQALRLAIPTRGRIAPCSLRQAASGGGPVAGQPCRPLRAALLAKTGRDEEVVPAVEQRGWDQEKERDETAPQARLRKTQSSAAHQALLRFARATDGVMTPQVGPGSAKPVCNSERQSSTA